MSSFDTMFDLMSLNNKCSRETNRNNKTIKKLQESRKPVKEGKWDKTLDTDIAKRLRTAVDEENSRDVLDALKDGYYWIAQQDDFSYDETDAENDTEDFDYIDDDEEEVNYKLNEFYDLCDALRIWVPTHFEEACGKKKVSKKDKKDKVVTEDTDFDYYQDMYRVDSEEIAKKLCDLANVSDTDVYNDVKEAVDYLRTICQNKYNNDYFRTCYKVLATISGYDFFNESCGKKKVSKEDKKDKVVTEDTQGVNTDNIKTYPYKVKEWYHKEYPDDDIWEEIDSDITFFDVYSTLRGKHDVYDVLGVVDSVVRERVFDKLSEIGKVDYDVIYNMWLGESKKSSKATKKLSEKVDPEALAELKAEKE